jgi:hypothetical protein
MSIAFSYVCGFFLIINFTLLLSITLFSFSEIEFFFLLFSFISLFLSLSSSYNNSKIKAYQ